MTDGFDASATATPEGAYANCLALSARHTAWLRAQGVRAGMLMLHGSRRPFPRAAGRWPDCDPAGFGHWVVAAGGWSVDWTYRQFEPDAPHPRIVAVAALADEWEEVRTWACADCAALVTDPRHAELAPPGLHAAHRARGGRAPFLDPRHVQDPAPLAPLCACGQP